MLSPMTFASCKSALELKIPLLKLEIRLLKLLYPLLVSLNIRIHNGDSRWIWRRGIGDIGGERILPPGIDIV